MKYLPLLFSVAVLLVTSCSSRKQNESETENSKDAIAVEDTTNLQLTATMLIKPFIQQSDSVLLTFTVYNPSQKELRFCKWHTPFEPPMSKFLDIADQQGNESQYQGAMAKRVMPPPASSYITVKAGDSLSTTIDLRKSYVLDQPGSYHIKYNSESISGLSVKDSITFELKK